MRTQGWLWEEYPQVMMNKRLRSHADLCGPFYQPGLRSSLVGGVAWHALLAKTAANALRLIGRPPVRQGLRTSRRSRAQVP